jgi:hypothetical protein
MSSVRMCDRCGEIFSEREEGWSTFTGTTRKRDDNGLWLNQSDTLDSCASCTELMTAPQRPVAALGTGVQRRYEQEPAAKTPAP